MQIKPSKLTVKMAVSEQKLLARTAAALQPLREHDQHAAQCCDLLRGILKQYADVIDWEEGGMKLVYSTGPEKRAKRKAKKSATDNSEEKKEQHNANDG